MPRHPRLSQETSPHLLQHAYSPVEWFPFGDAAFAEAKRSDRPIFVGIGASSCHVCHEMARDSFSNEAIARQLNDHFVSIKIDKDERPDLQELFAHAAGAVSGAQGSPLSVFLLPSGAPFFAGAYFPAADVGQKPGFASLLNRIALMWKAEKATLEAQANALTAQVTAQLTLSAPGAISEDSIRAACRWLTGSFDEAFGGFRGETKAFRVSALALLLRAHRRTTSAEQLGVVTRTLDAIMKGGVYDHLAGGFFHESVDRSFTVPRFEKRLSDNAQLAHLYLEAFQQTGHAPYRRVVRETLDFLLTEMQSPSGGFFSSLDSESKGIPGAYYLYSQAEVEKALGRPSAAHFCKFFGVTSQGNFRGKNIFTTRRLLAEVALELGLGEATLIDSLEHTRAALYDDRRRRPSPEMDDQIIASHTGLMLTLLSNAARTFQDQHYLDAAVRTAELLLSDAETGAGLRTKDGGLYRTLRAGRAGLSGCLKDYADVASGLLSLYEASGASRYLNASAELTSFMLAEFEASDTPALLSVKSTSPAPFCRLVSAADGDTPSGNAQAALVLGRLAMHLGKNEWRKRAEDILHAFSEPVRRTPHLFTGLLGSLDFLLEAPWAVLLAGDNQDPVFAELSGEIAAQFEPNRVVAHPSADGDPSPLEQRFRPHSDKEPTAYFLSEAEESTQASDLVRLQAVLMNHQRFHRASRSRELAGSTLPGRASTEGTARLSQKGRLPAAAYRSLGGLTISRLGVGTHRVGLDHPAHRATLRKALSSGLNLVDTSPHFALGDGERLIGQVLAELHKEGVLLRDEVVVISKVGVAMGPAADALAERQRLGKVPHLVPLGKTSVDAPPGASASLAGGAFCLEGTFLKQQVKGSLERLGLDHLDVCLIQSPEHLLAAGASRANFESALAEGFRCLEELAEQGVIGSYGILGNTLSRETSDPLAVDLPTLLALAVKAGGPTHHFQVVELPMNLLESEPLRAQLGADGVPQASLVAQARELGLSLLATRPLSPFVSGALLRLVDPPAPPSSDNREALKKVRYQLASLEAEFETTLAVQLRLAGKVDRQTVLPLSGPLGKTLEKAESRQQFDLAETTLVTPRLRNLIAQLDRAFSGPGEGAWIKFRGAYLQAAGTWLACVRESATQKNRDRLADLQRQLPGRREFAAQLAASPINEPWATRALRLIVDAPGVAGALVGLRSELHVEQALDVLRDNQARTDPDE